MFWVKDNYNPIAYRYSYITLVTTWSFGVEFFKSKTGALVLTLLIIVFIARKRSPVANNLHSETSWEGLTGICIFLRLRTKNKSRVIRRCALILVWFLLWKYGMWKKREIKSQLYALIFRKTRMKVLKKRIDCGWQHDNLKGKMRELTLHLINVIFTANGIFQQRQP